MQHAVAPSILRPLCLLVRTRACQQCMLRHQRHPCSRQHHVCALHRTAANTPLSHATHRQVSRRLETRSDNSTRPAADDTMCAHCTALQHARHRCTQLTVTGSGDAKPRGDRRLLRGLCMSSDDPHLASPSLLPFLRRLLSLPPLSTTTVSSPTRSSCPTSSPPFVLSAPLPDGDPPALGERGDTAHAEFSASQSFLLPTGGFLCPAELADDVGDASAWGDADVAKGEAPSSRCCCFACACRYACREGEARAPRPICSHGNDGTFACPETDKKFPLPDAGSGSPPARRENEFTDRCAQMRTVQAPGTRKQVDVRARAPALRMLQVNCVAVRRGTKLCGAAIPPTSTTSGSQPSQEAPIPHRQLQSHSKENLLCFPLSFTHALQAYLPGRKFLFFTSPMCSPDPWPLIHHTRALPLSPSPCSRLTHRLQPYLPVLHVVHVVGRAGARGGSGQEERRAAGGRCLHVHLHTACGAEGPGWGEKKDGEGREMRGGKCTHVTTPS